MAIIWLHCMAHFVIKTVPVRREKRCKGTQRPNRISKLNDKFKFKVAVVGAASSTAAASCGSDTFRIRSKILKLTFNRFLCKYSVQSKWHWVMKTRMCGASKNIWNVTEDYVAQTTIHLIGLTTTTTTKKYRNMNKSIGKENKEKTNINSNKITLNERWEKLKRREKTRLNVMESIRQHFEYGNMKLCSIFWLKCFSFF